MAKLISKNPATGEILQELDSTPIDGLPAIFARARIAQAKWAMTPIKKRATCLIQLRETLLSQVDEITQLISMENGKPRFEAMMNDLFPSVQMLSYFAKKAPGLLRDHRIPMTLMKHRKSYLNYWPLGTVVIISPWNFPFLLPFAEIAMALVTGNSVVFKPSEITPLTGLKIQELCEKSGLPEYILQTVLGDGSVGAALIQQKPAKIFFTGSVPTGKRIMAAAAEHLIPVNLELGGKNPMVILPDADLDYASSAALWGGFSNSGQVCGSTQRILVHESMATEFSERLREKISRLRQGPSDQMENDLGAIAYDRQKPVYQRQLEDAREKGAEFLVGGNFSENQRYLQPTLIAGKGVEDLEVYREETFGPVASISTYRSIDEAVQKANSTRYGLAAAVIAKDINLGEQVARQIEAGTVTVNEVIYTAGLPETPWGGLKDSGFGRSHSDLGIYEFVNVRHIHKPRSRLFVFKSPWWFPYTSFQYAAFRKFFELFRRHWLDRLRAFPHFLWNFVQFLKQEKRL